MNNIHLHIIGSESFFNLLDELHLNYTVSFDKNFKYKNQNLFNICKLLILPPITKFNKM